MLWTKISFLATDWSKVTKSENYEKSSNSLQFTESIKYVFH